MMKRFFTCILVTLLTIGFATGQKVNLNHLKGMRMRNIGPAGMSGRVTTIDVNLQNPDQIYVGTASGGVWRSNSGGIEWTPIFDEEALASIGAIAINQQNPSEIWVGTGEGNPRNSHNSGEGIYKSIDGGKSWKLMGLKNTRTIHRIYVDPHHTNTVYVAAMGSAWGPNPERGVYKTTDGGESWEKVLFVNDSTGCADLVMDPSNPNKLIAAMWEFGRKPHFFNSGGKGSGLYLTYDGGKTWKKLSPKEGLPKGNLGRIGLAIAPSKPNIVYALIEAKKNALYRSTDGGESWSMRADKDIGNRPFYYADIFVDPQNENRIFNLWSYLSVSEDGGKTFNTLRQFYGLHPDHHAFWIHPEDPDFIMEGNDGGLNITRNGGKNWRFVENLPLAQFYHINYDMEIPYNVYGGLQDNGSWVGPAYVWKYGGIRNYDFQEMLFGDGFDVVPRRDNPRYVYAMYQGGNVSYVDRKTGKSTYIQPFHPDGEELRFNWNAGIAADPFNDCGVYFGSQYLHKSLDCGQSWEIISPDLTTNDTSKQKQHLSGGLTIDDTRAENFTTIVSIDPSPIDENVIWVGTDDGNLQLTRDGGQSWENQAARLPGCKAGSWIPQIVASTYDAGEAFVVVNDYRRNDWRPMAYHTKDYGATWTRIADENKVNGHCLAIVQDPIEPKLLFLGTDYGLYVSIDKGTNWSKWTHDYPSAPTRDLKIHPREHDLIIGTFGRAIWILDDIRPLREVAQTGGKVLEQPFRIFPAPEAYQVEYRSYDGIRYTADAEFRGENRGSGPRVKVWVKPATKEKKQEEKMEDKGKKKKKKKKEKEEGGEEEMKQEKKKREGPPRDGKAKIIVFDQKRDTIRNYTIKLDTGLNRISWDMRRNGIRFPSERDPRKDADPPRGSSVLPGTYTIVVNYGSYRDSTDVEVKSDPRLEIDIEKLKAQEAARQDFYGLVDRCREAMDQLKEAKKTISLINKAMIHLPDSTQKEIRTDGKALQDSISNLIDLFRAPEVKGIQRTSDKLISKLYTASSYIGNSEGEPNQMARYAIAAAEKDAQKVISKVNAFIEKDWKAYQEKVEKIQFPLFKDLKTVEMQKE
jgi:photosystem II stability/assembly factor-like uncharacterized protein